MRSCLANSLLDLWGEDSPPSAANVFRQRSDGCEGCFRRVVLLPRGQATRCGSSRQALDVKQFEQLISEGREALVARAPAEAARTLDQALTLWRGPPLADFRYEPFAQAEIARLEVVATHMPGRAYRGSPRYRLGR